MRYIAVIHTWHVYSKGFYTYELEAKNKKDADKEAKVLTFDHDCSFSSADYTLIEIDDHERQNKLDRVPRWIRKLFNAM